MPDLLLAYNSLLNKGLDRDKMSCDVVHLVMANPTLNLAYPLLNHLESRVQFPINPQKFLVGEGQKKNPMNQPKNYCVPHLASCLNNISHTVSAGIISRHLFVQ